MATTTKTKPKADDAPIRASVILADFGDRLEKAEARYAEVQAKIVEMLPTWGWEALAQQGEALAKAQAQVGIARNVHKHLTGSPTVRQGLEVIRSRATEEVGSLIRCGIIRRSSCAVAGHLEGVERETLLKSWDAERQTAEFYLSRDIIADVDPSEAPPPP